MPFELAIVTTGFGAILGIIGTVLSRHYFDSRSEMSSLRREIFKDYMRMKLDGMSGLLSIQRSGALRLPRKEFDKLVGELKRCGHPPSTAKDYSHTEGIAHLYDVLLYSAQQEHEVTPGTDLYIVLCKSKGLYTPPQSPIQQGQQG
jgi:hypothetical protein